MKALLAFWKAHGTKILGYITLAVTSALIVPDLIPPDQMKYWLYMNAFLGGMTVKRGHTNTKTAANAEPVVEETSMPDYKGKNP